VRSVKSTEAHESEELLAIQSDLLERLASGASVHESLDHLCQAIESLVPNSVCAIMYFEPQQGVLKVRAAPNAPQSLCEKLDGLVPARDAASCGTAAYRGEAVIVEDTLTDPVWAKYRELATEYGIRACWSLPAYCYGELVGTFAISLSEPRRPTPLEMRMLETGCHLAGIGISRLRADEQRRHMEQKIQQAQKMESLGVLAGGIAHDFNNLLTSALGNVDLVDSLISGDSTTRPYLQKVESAILQMAELSRQMLAYSGGTPFDMRPVCLGDLIADMVDLLEVSVSKNATMRVEVPEKRPKVLGDPARLRQVIMNLITNASDAIGDRQGTLTLRLGAADVSPHELSKTLLGQPTNPGRYVWIEVQDTGRGMPAETQGRMFDPFFTTKHEGHGLGLAATLGIVRSHNGAIEIESTEGVGTRIRVLIPACTEEVSAPHSAVPEVVEYDEKGTVLVVDDEEYIRDLAENVLRDAGFEVLTSKDGEEAIQTFRRDQGAIDAVLLDFTMPGIDGAEVCRRLRAIRAVPVVLSSGYSEAEATHRLSDLEIVGYLQKPYRAKELAQIFLRVRQGQSQIHS